MFSAGHRTLPERPNNRNAFSVRSLLMLLATDNKTLSPFASCDAGCALKTVSISGAGNEFNPPILVRVFPAGCSRPSDSLCWRWACLWATLAIYYSNLPWSWARLGLAIVFAAISVWALWFSRRRSTSMVAIVLFLGVVAWWISIAPSHDRNWRPEVAVMPRAVVDGDRVRLTGVRNFDYRSRNDFTVRYQEREILLSHLTALDFYVSYFTEGPVGHTFVSFIFDNAPPLSISIETRPEVGEGFAPVASLFKQFELIYLVGDERDLVRVRTNYRGEPVYLYRLNTSADDARRLLLVYLDAYQ